MDKYDPHLSYLKHLQMCEGTWAMTDKHGNHYTARPKLGKQLIIPLVIFHGQYIHNNFHFNEMKFVLFD